MKIWTNGKFVDEKKAKISVLDRGFLYGDGLFETMRSYAGVIFKLDEHMARLFRSLKIMKFASPYTKKYLSDTVYSSLKINGLKSAYVRLAITRGEGKFGISYSDDFVSNVVIMAKRFEGYPDWMHFKGLKVKTASTRQNEYSPLAKVKSLNFTNYILARLEAKAGGADEAILLNTKGHVAEAATSNIFLVKKNTIFTPSIDCGILPGITRGVIMKIAKSLRIKVKETHIRHRELINADEVFLTNSLAEVLPVIRVDSKKIGAGAPGEITRLLHISYQKQVIRDTLL